MKQITFSYKNALISKKDFSQTQKILRKEIENMNKVISLKYEDDRSSINLLDDKKMLNNIKKTIKDKLKLKPNYLIVIGIGGSNLGTIAIQEAILGKSYNQLNQKIKILYADTVDTNSIKDIIKIITPVLKHGNIIINGISKSGSTTETIANFEILIDLLRKYKKNYSKYIVVTTEKNSSFWNLAIENKFSALEIPKKVGGRYSVFSSVGLFPLGLLGINIDNLLKGAKLSRKYSLEKNITKNPAAISAVIQYLHYKKGINISDLFLFGNDLESIGKWYRQLMAESIGKEFNINHKRTFTGITPTVSIGSTDLHSMAQLYLGGPYDKFTTFIKIEENSEIRIPIMKGYSELIESIEGKTLSEIMDAILKGVQIAFKKSKRPFVEISLQDKSEYSIGQLLQLKMIEMMYLGYLLKVNPFDQPNVESYKIETKKILKKIK